MSHLLFLLGMDYIVYVRRHLDILGDTHNNLHQYCGSGTNRSDTNDTKLGVRRFGIRPANRANSMSFRFHVDIFLLNKRCIRFHYLWNNTQFDIERKRQSSHFEFDPLGNFHKTVAWRTAANKQEPHGDETGENVKTSIETLNHTATKQGKTC